MAKQTTNRIAELRKAKGLTQAQLAEKIGVHWVTLSKLERGRMQLHMGWLEVIATALGVNIDELLTERPVTRTTVVSGYVEDGLYADLGEHQFLIEMPIEVENTQENFWVSVEGKSLWPNFHDGDLMQFSPVDREDGPLYVGRFVIASEKVGENRCGYIVAAQDDGKITLQVLNGPVVYGLQPAVMAVLMEVRFTAPWNLNLSSEEKTERGLAVAAIKG